MTATPIRIASVLSAMALAGCMFAYNMPTPAEQIGPAYVPSERYVNLDCRELRRRFETLRETEAVLVAAQNRRVQVSVWRSFFSWMGGIGDGGEASELANARGHMRAIGDVANERGCRF